MGAHRIRTCDLSDCFANRNFRCKMLDESIYTDCPFYKIGKMDMERYADIKSYKYAMKRISDLTERQKEKKEQYLTARMEYQEVKEALAEAKLWKRTMKNRIRKRLGLVKT